ncbi:MAG: hypothetical protein ACI945_001650, partial [Pseudohongiellaceae bacterium]
FKKIFTCQRHLSAVYKYIAAPKQHKLDSLEVQKEGHGFKEGHSQVL